MLFLAAMSFAQGLPAAITFSAASAAGTVKDSTFYAKNLTLQTVDPDGKIAVDANDAKFSFDGTNPIECAYRLKSGGKTNSDLTKNYLKLTAAKAGKLVIGVRTSSASDLTRTLVIKQGTAELYNQPITEAMKDTLIVGQDTTIYYHPVAVDVEAGEIILSYPVNALNFYCFALQVPELKTVLSAEKLWSYPIANMTAVGDARQGSGFNGTVYVSDKASHSVLAYSKVGEAIQKDTVVTDPAICSTGIAVDDAGNIVLSAPETTDAFYATPTHLLVVDKEAKTVQSFDITALGRTDFIYATGNIKGAEGGYVYLYGNQAKALAVHFVNGAIESSATIESVATAGTGGQVVYLGTPESFIAQVRASALQFVGREAVSLPNIFNSKLGLDKFTIAGKEVYAYNVGSAYNSYFQLYNATDEALIPAVTGETQLFGVDATKTQSTSCANWLRASVIDENNVYVHQYCGSDGAALWKVSAVVAAEVAVSCDETMGTVTGGGDIAVGANATVEATPKPGYEFVAWKNGEQILSTDAKYTFVANENVALTAVFEAKENVTITLAVNNNSGSINLPEGIVMGANSVVYGTPVALTAVPAEGATFIGWYKGDELYSKDYQISLDSKQSISLTAKFVNILTMAYELNGGITNDSNWVSKGQLMLEIQNDYNATYSASLAVVKEENGIYYFKIGDNWVPEAEAQGQDALVAGFFQNKTWSADQKCGRLFLETKKDKYQFLVDIIDNFRTTAKEDRGLDSLKNMAINVADAYFRADVSGFMLNSPATAGYPYTCNWSICGLPDAYAPVWKHAFANPTEIIAEVTLNAPYKEDATFDGWYAAADFSGEKITKVGPESNIPGNKLYAKWIEYIWTIKEVLEAEAGTSVRTQGTINFVDGRNVYMQDASGAILAYLKNANSSLKMGDKIVVTGKTKMHGGALEIDQAEVASSEAGTPMAETKTTLSALLAKPLDFYAKRVNVEGLKIAKYDNKSVYVTDGKDTVACYNVKPEEASFPVGLKVNLHMIGAYYNGFQFAGPVTGIEAAPLSGKDEYVYPARGENNEYTLTNKWLICDKLDNYSANRPASTNYCRGMAAYNGKMYFIDREHARFTVVDGATGMMLDPLPITGEHLFEAQDAEGAWKSCVTLAYNDVKFDNAGHCLITGCASGKQRAMVYVVDLATGAATELINEYFYDNPENFEDTVPHNWRMDAIGVYGDITTHAIIMFGNSMNASGPNAAYKWVINNGQVAGPAERIDLIVNPGEDDSYLIKTDGTIYTEDNCACQVFPVDEGYFYWDHHSCRPTLFTMDGTFADDLKSCPSGVLVRNSDVDSLAVGSGYNGICEFQIGEEYFVIMAATNNVENPASAFALYKYADAAKEFSGMTPMWFFPNGGMGGQTNAYRTAIPTVEVNGDKATIYLYAGENGYGVYEMTGVASGINNIESDVTVKKILENGHVYIIKNGVRYTVIGAKVK